MSYVLQMFVCQGFDLSFILFVLPGQSSLEDDEEVLLPGIDTCGLSRSPFRIGRPDKLSK